MHFSLLQSAFLLTAECISPYCRVHFSLLHLVFKRSCSPIPNQTEIATEEFCLKSLLRKQIEIDFIESHFQILHHLKIVHSNLISDDIKKAIATTLLKYPKTDVDDKPELPKVQGVPKWLTPF